MSLPYLASAADHQQLEWIGGSIMSVLLDGAATDGQLTMLRTRLSGGAASPVHVHSAEDELFVLLKGEGIFWAGEQRHGRVSRPAGLAPMFIFRTSGSFTRHLPYTGYARRRPRLSSSLCGRRLPFHGGAQPAARAPCRLRPR